MSIDAVIESMEVVKDDLVLNLCGRYDERVGYVEGPGQSVLTVLGFSKKPLIGEAIWGGSGECLTVLSEINYLRVGATRLRERKPSCAFQ